MRAARATASFTNATGRPGNSNVMTSILHLINCLERGGAEHVVLNLVRHRDRARFSPVVAYLFGEPELRQELEEAGATVIALGLHRGVDLVAATARLTRLILRVRPALLHTHLLHAEILGGVVGRAMGIPVVGTVHNVFWDDPVYPWLLRRAYRGTVRANAHTVAISHAVHDKLREAGVAEGRLSIVRNGLPRVDVLPRDESRRRLGLPLDGTILGAVGNLYPYKGHDLLVEALGKLAARGEPALLVIIGEGAERSRLMARARALGVGERLLLLGRRPAAASLLAAFDLFVQPSRSEGLGLALLEALGAGVPAVAFAVGGIPEVAGSPSVVRLVPPEDPGALADAIAELLAEPALRGRLVAQGRERAAAYDVGRMTAAYEQLYLRLLGQAVREAA